MIEVKRTVLQEVEITKQFKVKPFWRVRVLRPNGISTCFVEYEKEFEYEPKEQEIGSVLADNMKHSESFASVVKNYRLVEVTE